MAFYLCRVTKRGCAVYNTAERSQADLLQSRGHAAGGNFECVQVQSNGDNDENEDVIWGHQKKAFGNSTQKLYFIRNTPPAVLSTRRSSKFWSCYVINTQ